MITSSPKRPKLTHTKTTVHIKDIMSGLQTIDGTDYHEQPHILEASNELAQMGGFVHNVPSKGSCFYEATLHSIKMKQSHHKNLRKLVVGQVAYDWVNDPNLVFAQFLAANSQATDNLTRSIECIHVLPNCWKIHFHGL